MMYFFSGTNLCLGRRTENLIINEIRVWESRLGGTEYTQTSSRYYVQMYSPYIVNPHLVIVAVARHDKKCFKPVFSSVKTCLNFVIFSSLIS